MQLKGKSSQQPWPMGEPYFNLSPNRMPSAAPSFVGRGNVTSLSLATHYAPFKSYNHSRDNLKSILSFNIGSGTLIFEICYVHL